MIKRTCRYIAIILAVIVCLCGCQNNIQDVTSSESQDSSNIQEISYGLYCQVEEYQLPDWEAAMRELAGDAILRAGAPILYGEGCCQIVQVYGDTMMDLVGVYVQIFSFETEEWTAVSIIDDFERDGIAYDGIRMPFSALDGGLYCLVDTLDGETKLSTLGPDGVGEILKNADTLAQQIAEMGATGDVEVFLDAAGRAYLHHQELGIISTDMISYDEALQEQEQSTVQGWVYGGIQADPQSDVYFYGADETLQPAIWQADGEKTLLKGLDMNLANSEYLAAYSQNGLLCLTDSNHLWLMGDKGPEKVYNYMENGYYLDALYGMVKGENDTIQLLTELDEELTFLTFRFTNQPPAEKQELTVAFRMRNVALDNVIAKFNRQNSKYRVSLILPEDGEEDASFRKRIQMELSAGRGPDMLGNDVVLDLEAFVENGYLEYLDGQDFHEQDCMSAAFEECRVDGKLYGIPYDYSIDFAAYRLSDVGDVSSINMEELMQSVRESDAKVLQENLDGTQVVLKYALSDNSNRTYIDWENKKSHLTEQAFIDLLEFAKEYGDDGRKGEIQEKEIFAYGFYGGIEMGHFYSIREVYDALEGEARLLGYPRTEGNGIYISTSSIYVNSQSEGKDGAIAFLQYLISEEAQTRYVKYDMNKDIDKAGGFLASYRAQFPVNRAALEALLEHERIEDQESQMKTDDGRVIYTNPPYTQEQFDSFRFLVENAQASDYNISAIREMVMEELEPYFEGAVTAEQAASTLDSRVQLYLDEHN